ncbi:hypothetical protein P0O15_12235 [Methanotrichaceae archaeon Mx]|uniref:HhH-GPD domain-containing protein n=1 Tax=Candidatus Methanocrinis natronophilus TaxID=3033396 RepID=A0ABT5XB42_9EURY|nr:hypothetical protein [Candidatus Methanocrinis natronophilus]
MRGPPEPGAGSHRHPRPDDPYQNTTSANAHRAFDNLKRKYPDYGPLLAASDEEVAGLIRCGGLANIKTRRIKEALDKIREMKGGREIEEAGERKEEGGEAAGYDATRTADPIELDFPAGLDPQEARKYLLTLPGVGPKTAAVLLLFGFSMPFIPVDTHVNRLSRRTPPSMRRRGSWRRSHPRIRGAPFTST